MLCLVQLTSLTSRLLGLYSVFCRVTLVAWNRPKTQGNRAWGIFGATWTPPRRLLGALDVSDSSKSPKIEKIEPWTQNVDFLMILGTILASMFNNFLITLHIINTM